ncbi:sugar diacid utilization regulator [Paenibacillus polymyxa]|nr:sugar diacid utilization regulator [Paenibacillus polymyxa]KAF6657350.1 helix-turn-helix domain-containing protein [Paenibacillus sp. EKM301P]KJD39576.1 sugar diacid utilization regulator [Paenibacillus polymyxa]NMP11746.1 sugar diacid utilization regulator [Paenibacillus polymyxa]PNQ87263.1 sugar diacid utilization regulator [Paenibacillus polymyxa]
MFPLSERQAQDIVDKMMKDIPYNINIMNERGIIIGSGESERIGTIHQGAVQALETGKMIEVWQDGHYEKKGTNEPIVIHHELVGVIGISGNPDEVRPFCNIVKTTVSLLIEQRISLEHLAHEANRKKSVLEMLLNHQGAYTQKIKKEAAQYHIDLLLKTSAVYVKHLPSDPAHFAELSNIFMQHPSFRMEEDSYLILMQNQEPTTKLLEPLVRSHPDVLIAISRQEHSIADVYMQAKSAMNVVLALRPPVQIVSFAEVEFLVKLSQTNLTNTIHLVSKLEDTVDLLDTLRSFINHNGSVSFTADELNIHRNTLQYRLKRIHTLTGKDPRNLLQLFELTHGLLALHQ